MKKILRFITQRVVITALLIVLQALLLFGFIWKLDNYFVYFYASSVLLSLLIILGIINSKSNPAYKIAWLIPILLFPVFGGLIYLLFGSDRTGRYLRKKLQGIGTEMDNVIGEAHRRSGAEQLPPDAANQSRYISHCAYCPPYQNTTTEYLPLGEVKFERMVEELKKAKHYIFLEYFIIQEGKMWNTILDILRQKAAEGVDVRVIYDDMGCIMILPTGYDKTLEQMGIKCRIFNPFVPILSSRFNTRDHRKICVIDSEVAFTGGVNLADEYINRRERFGHWLDCGVMLRGEAVYSFTLMFLSMWDYIRHEEDDASRFLPRPGAFDGIEDDGFVQPYSDAPSDDEAVGETAYINMLSRAEKYVYICTPYLVIDNELMNALTSAAKSGIDVRMITPGVPDKWYVHMVTRSYYAPLLRAGVRVYEYIPGFIHSKTMVCDDAFGICGTINLDYRSLFLHHECAVWMFGSSAIMDMKQSFTDTLSKCVEITPELYRNRPWLMKLGQSLLRVFAPLM